MWREKIGLLPAKTTTGVRIGARAGAGRGPLQDFVTVVSAVGAAEIQAQAERDDSDDSKYREREATDATATVGFSVRFVCRLARPGPRPPRCALRFPVVVRGAERSVSGELSAVEMHFEEGEFGHTDGSTP
jgi:hypothetical protein